MQASDARPGGAPQRIAIEPWGASRVMVTTPAGKRRQLARSGLEVLDLAWEKCARECGRSLDELREAVREALAPSEAEKEPEIPPRIWARAERATRAQAQPFDGQSSAVLRKAFEAQGSAWVEWDRADLLAVLDVDWHGAPAPAWPVLEAALLSSGVVPAAYWRSRNGGLHAVIESADGLRADELAAACAVGLLEAPALADCTGVEVISRTGVPPADAPQSWQPQRVGELLRSWQRRELDQPSAEEIEEYRSSRGWLGRDATHDQCPIDPKRASAQAGRRPVFFGERGVTCLSCSARGIRPGGFVPWAELLRGQSKPNRILTCARALTCWSHASLVLAHDIGPRLPAHAQRLAYTALCRILHGADDPRIARLSRSDDGDFVRGISCWLDPRSGYAPVKPDPAYLRLMPSNTFVKDDGEIGIDATAISRCSATGEVPGFPPIIPVRGVQLWGAFNAYPSIAHALRVPHYSGSAPAPRYRSADSYDREGAWAELQGHFPGLRRDYLTLLLVARGYAESGAGRVPRILATGPSGSAKSTTVGLAAAIVGDTCEIVPDDPRTFRETFDNAAANSAGWILCDELAKPQPKRLVSRRSSSPFAIFLPLEQRNYTARLLYIGPIRTLMQSVVVVTGTQLPDGMSEDRQLARRFVHVRLPGKVPVQWDAACGFGDAARVREHLADACDAIWSGVVDDFFVDPLPTFEDAARQLGFGLLQDTQDDEAADGEDGLSVVGRVRELFDLLCSGEGSAPPPARAEAAGRRRYDFGGEQRAAQLWRELCDDAADSELRYRSERVSELDLRQVLGVTRWPGEAVWLEIRGEGRAVYLRFGVGPHKHPHAVNAELLAPE